MMRLRISCCLVAASLFVLPDTRLHARDPVPPGNELTYQDYAGHLDATAEFTRQFQGQLDRSSFDFDALLESLDYDPQNIVDFVRGSISLQQYPGVLRGPLGTLLARSGNSLDQSLLLAKLLRDAGFDARVATARLSTPQAALLLEEMKRPASPHPPVGNAEGLLRVIEQHSDRQPLTDEQTRAIEAFVRAPPEASTTDMYPLVQDTTEFLLAKLEQSGGGLGGATDGSALVEEAREYGWVQYKEQVADPWTDVHPAFAGEPPAGLPAAEVVITGPVPDSLQHRLRFQVFVERKTGDRLEVIPLGKPWERPVANLVGVPLTFYNVPNSLLTQDVDALSVRQVLPDATAFAPVFGQAIMEGAGFFDLHGNIIDPMVAGSPGSGVFEQVGRGFRDGIAALGSEAALPTLTAQWLEFSLIEPGGRERQYRRVIFDRIGAAARTTGRLPEIPPTSAEDARPLLQRTTFMISAGAVPRAYAMNQAAEHMLNSIPLIQQELRRGMQLPVNEADERRAADRFPPGWAGHLTLFSLFDMAESLSAEHRLYRSGPALVLHRTGLGRDDKAYEAIDIVTNPRRAVRFGADGAVLDPGLVARAGVWETAVEGTVLRGTDSGADVWSAFEQARKAGIQLRVITGNSLPPDIALSGDTRAAIGTDLQRGFAVIVPEREPAAGRSGWWRIDPASGETVGQFGDGRGTAVTERTALQNFAATFSKVCLAAGLLSCAQSSGSYGGFLCCGTINVGLFMFGLAQVKYAVSSILYDVITYVGPFTGPCSMLDEKPSPGPN